MEGDDEVTAEIKAQVEEWSTNTNECFTVELLKGNTAVASFQPEFTYPIFGDEEVIFGYRDLSITLSFAAHNLRPHLDISHGKVFKAQGEVRPTDINEALADFLPSEAFSKTSRDDALREVDAASFQPPGQKIHGYTKDGQKYEIWCASLADLEARSLLENMQILAPMFIEGGTMLQLGQDWSTQRWKLFLLYQVEDTPPPDVSRYSLAGYGTSYRVFAFPNRLKTSQENLDLLTGEPLDALLLPPDQSEQHLSNGESPLDLPSRERLSQFLILPPFQGSGHGQHLYNTMYSHLTAPSNIREITVEDPNEAFDDLRDLCDLLHLRAHIPDFAALRINSAVPAEKMLPSANIPTDLIVDGAARQRIQSQTKIVDRQFDRLVEMHTLSFIPVSHRSRNRITRKEKSSNPNDKAYFFWRLYAKHRLYIHNRDQLIQLEAEERGEKLEAALDSVQEGYVKMLERIEARWLGVGVAGQGNGVGGETVGGPAKPVVRKRKVIEEDEEEEDKEGEDGEWEGVAEVVTNGHKKSRVE